MAKEWEASQNLNLAEGGKEEGNSGMPRIWGGGAGPEKIEKMNWHLISMPIIPRNESYFSVNHHFVEKERTMGRVKEAKFKVTKEPRFQVLSTH